MSVSPSRPELTCPAGKLPALKAAVDNGADCVYVGFRDETSARAFGGLNFDVPALREGIDYAHRRGSRCWWRSTPSPRPQAGRAGPPPSTTPRIEIEAFGYGSLSVMVEGRCALSAYAAGESPNCQGVCSPAKAVRWEQRSDGMRTRLNGFLIDEFHGDERPGYPTLCKGRFDVDGATYYALEEPTSLNTLDLLPELMRIGVAAIKIEGRQRSPAYVAQVTRVWRGTIDACAAAPQAWSAPPTAHAG